MELEKWCTGNKRAESKSASLSLEITDGDNDEIDCLVVNANEDRQVTDRAKDSTWPTNSVSVLSNFIQFTSLECFCCVCVCESIRIFLVFELKHHSTGSLTVLHRIQD